MRHNFCRLSVTGIGIWIITEILIKAEKLNYTALLKCDLKMMKLLKSLIYIEELVQLL